MIALLIVAFAVILLIQVPKLIKKKYWRELLVYSVLMTLAFVMCLLYALHVDIQNPVKNTQYYIKDLFPFSYQ